ncbi:MAG: fumarylacetoacetate hydrolase family protein [Euryarchaeota archaeon]|nr:fumarylacetoacetate hydrolase family protein [Euryarchaeota archaeon]
MASVKTTDGARVRVGKIVAVGQNYADHAREMGSSPGQELTYFLKPSTSILHDGGVIKIAKGIGEVHHEVELAVVIGRRSRDVHVDASLGHVLGYCVAVDVTARDLQRKAKLDGRPWTISKGYDTFFPVSDCVPRENVPDLSTLELRLRVNGQVRQHAHAADMTRAVPELISKISSVMTLERGDIVSTGTPGGVGPLKPGDTVVAELVGLASLTCKVKTRPERK